MSLVNKSCFTSGCVLGFQEGFDHFPEGVRGPRLQGGQACLIGHGAEGLDERLGFHVERGTEDPKLCPGTALQQRDEFFGNLERKKESSLERLEYNNYNTKYIQKSSKILNTNYN